MVTSGHTLAEPLLRNRAARRASSFPSLRNHRAHLRAGRWAGTAASRRGARQGTSPCPPPRLAPRRVGPLGFATRLAQCDFNAHVQFFRRTKSGIKSAVANATAHARTRVSVSPCASRPSDVLPPRRGAPSITAAISKWSRPQATQRLPSDLRLGSTSLFPPDETPALLQEYGIVTDPTDTPRCTRPSPLARAVYHLG